MNENRPPNLHEIRCCLNCKNSDSDCEYCCEFSYEIESTFLCDFWQIDHKYYKNHMPNFHKADCCGYCKYSNEYDGECVSCTLNYNKKIPFDRICNFFERKTNLSDLDFV